MLIKLFTSARPDKEITSYTSSVVPRVGEHLRLAPHVIMQVTDVCYCVQEDAGVELQITADNDAARHYLGEILYMTV